MPLWKMVVNFEELREISGDLGRISGHVQDMAENHGLQVISGIKTAWGGENADAFIAKEVKLLNRLYEVAEGFREVANQLEEKAEQIYTLEKGNVLTAQTRTY